MTGAQHILAPGERWKIITGDCLEVLRGMPAGSVDAVVTDPPYGISHPTNYATRRRGGLTECRNDYPTVHGDDKPFDPAPLLAIDVPTVLWGGNWFADRLPASGGWIVWDKERPDTLDQATCELAWTNCVKGVRRFRHLWNGMMRASEHGENYHPTQKPVALYSWLFALPWIPQGTIFDPYAGAGPCGVAALLSGRRYIGVEINDQYAAIARRRCAEAAEAFSLFEPPAREVQGELLSATGLAVEQE